MKHRDVFDGNYIFGTYDDDFIYGTRGNDYIGPNTGFDIVYAGRGNDVIDDSPTPEQNTKSLNDVFFGGTGRDTLITWAGNDSLYGNGGNDRFESHSFDSFFVDGGTGRDVLLLDERYKYTETHAHGATILTLESDFLHQAIVVTNVEVIKHVPLSDF